MSYRDLTCSFRIRIMSQIHGRSLYGWESAYELVTYNFYTKSYDFVQNVPALAIHLILLCNP